MKPGLFIHLIFFFLIMLLVSCNRVQTDYYPNGNIRSEITMKRGHYHGRATFHYDDGTILMECTYVNDSLDGLMTRYYETGTRKEMMFYKKNRPDSIYRLWNPQEKLLVECFYRDSLLNGSYREFYNNGQIKSSGQYNHGQMEGQWLFYDQNGYIFKKENYEGKSY